MAVKELEVTIRLRAGAAVLDLRGDIDGRSDAVLNQAYTDAVASGPERVLLNFADVDYINSTGIALIVGLLASARREGRAVLACGLADHYRQIFEITRLSDFMAIFPDEDRAVGGVPA